MKMKRLNTKKVSRQWAPQIQKLTGINESEKLDWISEVAHNQYVALNEDAGLGVGAGTKMHTLHNTVGVGDVVPPSRAGLTAGEQADNRFAGSGDQFGALLPIAIKVAAKTIGLDLVHKYPLQGPTGALPYLDYVYSGSKQPYGATPAYDEATANPKTFRGEPAYKNYSLPSAFKAEVVIEDAEAYAKFVEDVREGKVNRNTVINLSPVADAPAGDDVDDAVASEAVVSVQLIGLSRIDANPMFKVVAGNTDLGSLFAGATAEKGVEVEIESHKLQLVRPAFISMMEDHILGYAGSGKDDNDVWSGTYQDGTQLFEPMSRGAGEMQYPRALSLQLFTKMIQVGSQQVSVSVTHEQVTDLQKQWKIDAVKLVEDAAVNELTQSLNRHITSRLFGLGWKNHLKLNQVEGVNLNLDVTGAGPANTPAFAFPVAGDGADGNAIQQTNQSMPMVKAVKFGDFENKDTMMKRVFEQFLSASNWIMQKGRRGPGTFAVTNIKIGTALQTNAQYSFAPIANTINQTGGSLYPLGTVAGLTIYVDPLMSNQDTRVLVGRKSGVTQEETGVIFCPYLLAESIKFIGENTGAQRVIVKSRYALVDYGHHPETSYLTFFVNID